MNYYRIIDLSDIGYNPIIGIKPQIYNNLGRGNYDLQKGIYINDWDKRNKLFYEKGGILEDYLCNTLTDPIISKRIKEEMEEKKIEGVQYLPIKLEEINNPTNIIEGYYIVNILNILEGDVIDEKLSKFGVHTYMYFGIYKEKVKGYDIFRIRTNIGRFVISEKIKNIIEKYKHSVEFRKVRSS